MLSPATNEAFGPARRERYGVLAGVTLSVFVHGALMLWLVQLPAREASRTAFIEASFDAPPPAALPPGVQPGREARAPDPVPVVFGGPDSAQNLDTGRLGLGGDGESERRAALLASRADAIYLQDTPMNAPGVAQRQRIATADDRASWENRRATPNPNDQPFLATGPGGHRERRPVSERDAAEGAPRSPAESALGAATPAAGREGTPTPDGRGRAGAGQSPLLAPEGGPRTSPGAGIADGRGARETRAARVATGRPPVDEGPAATTASQAARVRDDTDSELLASQLTQSWVDATPQASRRAGRGRGGAGGGGDPGVGGSSGAGGEASPYAPGPGGRGALDTSDRRYRQWYLRARRRVRGAMRFPRQRALAMDQGVAVFRFHVDAEGRLLGTPRLMRSSGFGDIDRAALRAIQQSAPFGPLPAELMRGHASHSVRMSLDFSNPLVR